MPALIYSFDGPTDESLDELCQRFGKATGKVTDDEACERGSLVQQHVEVTRSARLRVVVGRNQPAQHDARMHLQSRQRCFQLISTDVFKQHRDSVGTEPIERGAHVVLAVVDAAVKAQLLGDVLTLVGGPGDADDASTGALGKLSGERSHRSSGSGDEHGVTGLRLSNRQHAKVGRQSARDAECAKKRRRMNVEVTR